MEFLSSIRHIWSVWGIIANINAIPRKRRRRDEDHMPSNTQLTPPVVTRDGRLITIRLIQSEDKDALLAFGIALPEEDWLYLESDMRSADTVARLANAQGAEHWRQVVAVDGDRIAFGKWPRIGFVLKGTKAVELEFGQDMVGGG